MLTRQMQFFYIEFLHAGVTVPDSTRDTLSAVPVLLQVRMDLTLQSSIAEGGCTLKLCFPDGVERTSGVGLCEIRDPQ